MDHLSLSVQNLAPSVRVITNVGNFHTPVIEERSTSPVQKVGCLPAELIKVFQKEPLSHPPAMAASNKRYAEEAIKRIFSFHSSHLNTFLNAYMYPNARIPEDVLDEIRLLCANGDSDWAYRCQRLALEVLEKAVFAKTQQVVPSMKLDDPTSLSALRGVLPVMVPVPSVAMKLCHFFFIGLSPCTAEEGSGSGAGGDRDSNESGGSDRIPEEGEGGRGKGRINLAEDLLSLMAAEKLVIKNKGYKPFRLEISQTQTVVDNVREVKEKRSVFPLDNPVDVKPGDRLELFLTNLAPVLPSTHFSYFQQLIVFSIEGVFRIFVTVTVVSVSPPQPLALNFPACLPLPVKDSVIGAYSAPLFLQWLKYLFSIRGGYRDASVSHLLLGKSANFQLHNEGIMQVVARLRRSVLEDLPILKTLDAFWAGFSRVPKKTHTLLSSRHIPPGSPSCPEKYFSCSSTFSSSSSSWWRPRCSDEENETIFYPNPGTPFPDDLKEISSSVLFGLMLQWLAETPVNVFDTSCINCDPISYLQAAPSHHRGILMYIIDLCCSFVAFRKFNGVTPRTLALTFASVLCRQPRHHSLASIDGSTSSFETYVVTQQSAVSALLCWMQVFGWSPMRSRRNVEVSTPKNSFVATEIRSPLEPPVSKAPDISTSTNLSSSSSTSRAFVHPLAAKVNGLLSPMSMKDQERVSGHIHMLISFSVLVFLPIALIAQNVLIAYAGVTVAGLIAMLLAIPNWKQNKDTGIQFVSKEKVYYYYKDLDKKRKESKDGKGLGLNELPSMPKGATLSEKEEKQN